MGEAVDRMAKRLAGFTGAVESGQQGLLHSRRRFLKRSVPAVAAMAGLATVKKAGASCTIRCSMTRYCCLSYGVSAQVRYVYYTQSNGACTNTPCGCTIVDRSANPNCTTQTCNTLCY